MDGIGVREAWEPHQDPAPSDADLDDKWNGQSGLPPGKENRELRDEKQPGAGPLALSKSWLLLAKYLIRFPRY